MLNKVIRRKQPKGNFAFIDSQNLNLGVQRIGWKMSWRKLLEYLQAEHGVTKAFLFIGYMQENEDLYKQMHEIGYHVILKPTLDMFEEVAKKEDKDIKGNCDADLVLEAMKQWPNYQKAIIISGDGDFYGLIEHLAEKNKLLNVMVPNWQYSSLLKDFEKYIVRVDKLQNRLQHYDKRKPKTKFRHTQKKQRPNNSQNRNKN
ncbi:NYN domain-containing protein [Candidatus Saccharibacteria bacterium]|nr:NYN domain-containing protein [Candidatus Saccharibacteria bacterium]MCB9821381.1 NYN domain-containing protein [Candidatus Nomurabacteria bacterium]